MRILLADDHGVVRHGLRQLLEQEPGWKVCGEAGDGRSAVALACALAPNVAIMDIAMPELNGLEAARKIRATCPATEVLVFTMYETEDLVADVFAAGARGYVMKSDPPHHIIAAIETVASHEPFFSTRVSAQLLETFLRDRAEYAGEDPTGATLSTREREVVQLLAEGRRNKEIALRLSIGVKTVETHRAAIMRKIGAASIAEVVRYAVRSRIASA